MTGQDKVFHKFQGLRLLTLIVVTMAYTYWFTVHGPYSKLAALGPGLPLEGAMYYSGAHAVSVLGSLDAAGRKMKYFSLAGDVPFMILQALLLEGLIAFGLRHLGLMGARWRLLFFAPLAFLMFDFLEDSFLALTLASGSEALGTLAGLMTPMKMATYTAASILALVLSVSGLAVWLAGKSKFTKHS